MKLFLAISFCVIFALCVIFAIGFSTCTAFTSTSGTFTITGKESVKHGEGGKYLVYTDVTTYEVEDSFIYWRWDSSDVYGALQIGKTYRATLQGWRVPFLSMYQNIIKPVEVAAE
jgi:hypothetical protein